MRLAALLAFFLLTAVGTSSLAQTPPTPPAPAVSPQPLPQEQFDALVKAITTSVIEKLKADAAAPKPADKPAETKTSRFDADAAQDPDAVTMFVDQSGRVMRDGLPALVTSVGEFARAIDNSARGGRGYSMFLLLALAAAVALSLEALLHVVTRPAQRRIAASAAATFGTRSLASLATLAMIDGVGVLLIWLVCRVAGQLWFNGDTVQDSLGTSVLSAFFYWRLYVLGFRLIVRPALPAARLCDMTDDEAWRMLRYVSGIVLLAAVFRAFYLGLAASGAPADAIAAGRVLTAPIMLAILLAFAIRAREGAQSWLLGLARVAPWNGFVGRHWRTVAGMTFVVLVATQLYGAVTEHLKTPSAVLLTLNLLIGLVMFETLLQAGVRRLDSQLDGFTPASDRQRLPDVLARCARVFALILVIVTITESWVVNVLGFVDERAWDRLARVGRATGITLFSAFVLWELFKYSTEAYVERIVRRNAAAGPAANAGAGAGPVAGSIAARFDTLMPVIRVTVATIILIVAVLVALDELGVNTAPLLAGASVLGLAISFGSQALVKDIVSGIFYLADDAFRVGEYIRCGQAEGTVEGFTLRSIRLRHRDGQIHVIPFGDLGQIANFSRDWAAVKFNLRFARDTDVEKLREATKKIAADLMAEPDLKAEILEPLRVHSVAEVADNALVVRFKLKTLPANSGAIQDRALRRLLKGMPELGIAFAA